MFWSTLAYTSITAGEVTKAFQQYQATKRKNLWSERECERALRDVRLTMINTVREELRDQVTVVSSSLQSMMVQTSLVLIVGFGSVCEGTFPDAEVGATDYPGLEQFFLEVYAFFAGLTLVLPLGSLLLTFAISRELEFFVAASFADLKQHVRRALRRTWPDHGPPSTSERPDIGRSPALSAREERARGLEAQRDNDALRAVLEDTRAVHGLAQDLLRQVQYFNKLYPLAYILLLSGLVSAVCECMVLLSLIFVHHFPTMPVLWQVYCGTVGVGASLALAVFLLSLWASSSPRVEKEEEANDAALSPARRRSSKRKQHWLRQQQERALEHLREPLLR
ncbi:unnamed protein product [Symbiodinium microadriaticum]|nr:unnamed protein product [Symbiodinium microadriaticum]CAE7873652.1 unnamed protein product [Symbiodinium sp. KB8]